MPCLSTNTPACMHTYMHMYTPEYTHVTDTSQADTDDRLAAECLRRGVNHGGFGHRAGVSRRRLSVAAFICNAARGGGRPAALLHKGQGSAAAVPGGLASRGGGALEHPSGKLQRRAP